MGCPVEGESRGPRRGKLGIITHSGNRPSDQFNRGLDSVVVEVSAV